MVKVLSVFYEAFCGVELSGVVLSFNYAKPWT